MHYRIWLADFSLHWQRLCCKKHVYPSQLLSDHVGQINRVINRRREQDRIHNGTMCRRRTGHAATSGNVPCKQRQDGFLPKEARLCVSSVFVIQNNKLKFFCCCGRWASDRGSRCANVKIVVEWKGILVEGAVMLVWIYWENPVVKMINDLLTQCCESIKNINMWTLLRSIWK